MPELPEVQTLASELADLAPLRICGIRFLRADLREPIPTRDITSLLAENTYIHTFARRAKYLLMHVHCGKHVYRGTLICHLGMSGAIRVCAESESTPLQAHTHWILKVCSRLKKEEERLEMRYIDPRRFGRLGVYVGEKEHLSSHPFLKHLGVEPFFGSLTTHLVRCAAKKRSPVKSLIMDQRVVVGVGNIYACEALYRAGISPFAIARELAQEDYKRLARAIRACFKEATAAGGATLKDFYGIRGDKGMFPLRAKVYGREGEECERCGDGIVSLRQGGRSTFICPSCQTSCQTSC